MLHRLFFYWPAPKSKPIHLASLCCPLPGREPPPSAHPSSPFVWLSYLSPCLFFATPHQTFQASDSFTTFFFSLAPRSPLKSGDSAPPLSKPLSLAVSSRVNAARLCQCQVFADRCICVPVWVWWKAPDLGARVVFKSRAGGCQKLGQVDLCWYYSRNLRDWKQPNRVESKCA